MAHANKMLRSYLLCEYKSTIRCMRFLGFENNNECIKQSKEKQDIFLNQEAHTNEMLDYSIRRFF